MASLADVFTEKERTNWLKAWLAVDIAKSGLDQFAETEAKTVHTNIYNAVLSSVKAPAACTGCYTANLLKCPTHGICNKRGANSPCKAMHDTAAKQPRPCPTNVCNKVLDEIKTLHKFASPSWKNTMAEQWAHNPWQIAKTYLPPDGYIGKSSVQDTDFNGIISFMMNCKHFDSKFSLPIAKGKNNPQCLLTKAREIGRTMRHSSQCKLTDPDLQDIFTILTSLLTDPTCLAHDIASQEAVKQLAKLQHDVLRITTEEMRHLLDAVQDKLKEIVQDTVKEVVQDKVKEVENTAKKALDEIRVYLEKLDEHTKQCEVKLNKHTGKCEVKLDEHTGKCEVKLDEHTGKCEVLLYERTGKCEVKLDEHTGKCEVKLDKHTGNCEEKLDEHTEQLKNALDEHFRKSAESNYEQSCDDLRRRLVEHYNDTSSNVPLSALDQSLDKRITDIYATPTIHRVDVKKDGTRKKEETILSYKEMFYRNDNSYGRIYVQGNPGSGKSTFAAKLVHDWCHGNQPVTTSSTEITAFCDVLTITQFKFIFFISLRDARGQKDITQMIKVQLVDRIYSEKDVDRVSELVYKIMETEVCLVVRDGLDEWVAPDGCNLAEPSMTGLQKSNVTVLTTARPWKLADERIKNSQIDILLEIEGIANADKFCEKVLACIIDKDKVVKTVEEFQKFVKKRKLTFLSSSPMLYTLVICTWVGTMKEEEQLDNSSLCALYTSLLESLCKKANSTPGYFNDSNPSPVECFSSTRFIQPNIEHLDELAAAAFKLLFSFERETSIVFSDITLSNYISKKFTVCKAFALKAGILTNRKDKSRTGSSNSFIHKTMQEFLAAYYIARNARVIDDIIDRYLKRYTNSYLDISQVFIFLCGMNIVAANTMSGLMNECDTAHCKNVWPLLQCAFQKIILDGIKEAAARKQDGICPKLSHFHITGENIGDLYRVWSANTSNVQLLTVHIFNDQSPSLSSPARGQPITHFEFNLSSCHKLKQLCLKGNGILLKDNDDGGHDDEEEEVAGAEDDDDDDDDDDDGEEDVDDEEEDEGSNMQLLNQSVDLEDEDDYEDSIADGVEDNEEAGEEEDDDDDSYFVTSELPIWIVINKAEPAQCGYPPPVLASIRYIELTSIKCSFSRLRSLFSTLLTLDHEVKCKLYECNITSSVEGAVRGSTEYTSATIRTGFNNTFHIHCSSNGPLFWEALHGMNIKCLRINELEKDSITDFVLFLHKSLQSLSQLETLNISVDAISTNLWEALHSLNIKTVTLSQKGRLRGVIVNSVSKLSQVLISPTQMETIILDVNAHPDLLEALCGRNIKSLCLHGRGEHLKVNHVSALCKSLLSLKQLVTLDVMVKNDSPSLWKAFHGLNIKSLSLSVGLRGVNMKHASAFTQLLASLTRLETLSIEEIKDSQGLCLSWSDSGGEVNHESSLLQSLASLTRLETLRIEVLKDSQGLWEAIRGLHITRLCLSSRSANHVEAMSKSLSSLTQLETLSIKVTFISKELCQALNNLKIKSLSLSLCRLYGGFISYDQDWLSQALSTLSQLDTLSLYLFEYIDLQLPQTFKYLNIYSDLLHPYHPIRWLVATLSACTQRVEIRLHFCVPGNESKEQYIEELEQLKTLKNVKMTRFLIYNWNPSIETGSDWCVQNVVVDVDGNDDDDNGDDEVYKQFIDNVTVLQRIYMRFCINYSTAHAKPAKSAASPRPLFLVLDGITRRIDESRGIDPRHVAESVSTSRTFAE